MSTSIKHRLSLTSLAAFVALACSALTLPVLAVADGQHNDKTCYAQTAGGIEMSSPCSSRGTSCNDDFTCSINGVAGNMGDGLEMNKADLIPVIADEPTDTSSKPLAKLKKAKKIAKKLKEISNQGGNKATDYNSSRSNKSEQTAKEEEPETDDDPTTEKDGTGNLYKEVNVKPIRLDLAIAAPDADDDNEGNKATDYNSSRSNKADGIAAPDGDATTGTTDVFIKIPPIKGDTADAKSMPGNGPDLVELGQPTYDKPAKAKAYIKIDDIKGNARTRGDVILDDVTVTKELDKSSKKLDADSDDDGIKD